MTELLILYVVGGALLDLLSLPLLAQKIPPNRFYGFRVRATVDNPALWYTVNRYAARRMMWAGFAIIAGAVALYSLPNVTLPIYALSLLCITGVAIGISIVQTLRYLRTLTPPTNSTRG